MKVVDAIKIIFLLTALFGSLFTLIFPIPVPKSANIVHPWLDPYNSQGLHWNGYSGQYCSHLSMEAGHCKTKTAEECKTAKAAEKACKSTYEKLLKEVNEKCYLNLYDAYVCTYGSGQDNPNELCRTEWNAIVDCENQLAPKYFPEAFSKD